MTIISLISKQLKDFIEHWKCEHIFRKFANNFPNEFSWREETKLTFGAIFHMKRVFHNIAAMFPFIVSNKSIIWLQHKKKSSPNFLLLQLVDANALSISFRFVQSKILIYCYWKISATFLLTYLSESNRNCFLFSYRFYFLNTLV